jgi:uncharacterized repeat protein (TIGR01451 family)
MNKRNTLLASIALALGLMLTVLAGVGQATSVSQVETTSIGADGGPPTLVELQDGCFRVTYLGTTYNADGTSTWRYSVEELGTGPECADLSNWMVELPSCAPIVDAGPEPWEYVHPDPNFHMWGIKWQTGAGFEQGEFWVTVQGHWALGETTVGIKSGNGIDTAPLAGPICVTYALSGTKTVEPAEAGPGDTLTYTIVVSNAGPADAAGLQVVDPIPEGTVCILGSAWASSGVVHQSTHNIGWTGYLTAGHTVTIGFQVYVDYWVTPGSVVTNTATVIDAMGNSFELTATTLIGPVTPRPWTFLVYLSADSNMDDQRDRLVYDLELFNGLERAAARNPGANILVQWDRSPDHAGSTPDDHTRRYHVLPNRNPYQLADYVEGATTWDLGELNMGDGQTLYSFTTWARSTFTPTTYTALSLVGHGGGWSPSFVPALGIGYLTSGMGWDDSSGDCLGTREIGDALYWATDEGEDLIDVLFLDASMMGMLENAYEVRDSTHFLVASESAVWSRFPYEGYAGAIGMDTTPRELAEAMVRVYDDSLLGYPRTMAALAVDVSAVGPISQALDSLALALSDTLTTTTRLQIAQAYSAVQKFDSDWDYTLAAPDAYVDLYDLAEQLAATVTDTAVLSATRALTVAIGPVGGDVIVEEQHHDGHPWVAPSQTWTFTGAHGLAIYFPLGEDFWIRDYYQPTELDLAAHTHWDEFLHLGWYEGRPAPSLPGTLRIMSANAGSIDPALRPGLLPVRRFWAFLPIVMECAE